MAENKFIKAGEKFTGVYYKILSDGSKTWYITYKVNGVKKFDKVAKNDADINATYCKRLRDDVLYEIKHGIKKPPVKHSMQNRDATFDEIATKYLQDKDLSKSSLRSYGNFIRKLFPFIGNKTLKEVKIDDFNRVKNELKSLGKANKTINAHLEMARAVFNFAIDADPPLYVGANPCKKVSLLPVDNDRDRYLTHDEVAMLKEAIKGNHTLELFVDLSLSTGARLGSILSITKKDINFTQRTISIRNHKSKNSYTGFISDNVLDALQKRCDEITNPNERILNTSSRTVQRELKEMLDKLFNQGLDTTDAKNRVVVHTLRHTFASNLAIRGTPLYTIMKLLDHKSIEDTQRYAKLAPNSGLEDIRGLFQ